MYTYNFLKSLEFTLTQEGGYTVDQGGPTMHGITQTVYDAYRIKMRLKIKPVLLISQDEERAIYNEYWLAIHGDYVPFPISTCLFDAAVNCGVGRAIGFLYNCLDKDELHAIFPNTNWTPQLSDCFWNDIHIKLQKYLGFCYAYNTHRLAWYNYLKRIFPNDENGWHNRVANLNDFCSRHK